MTGPPRIDRLPTGTIHAVGPAGLEVAAMVRYLVERGRDDIVLHDLAPDFDTAFGNAHRFQPAIVRQRAKAMIGRCRELRTGSAYLAGIEEAAAVLIPVAWFLHPANAQLMACHDRFVTYPDACFDLFAGPVVGITGSYGKTTTTRFVATLLDGVFCGNDREAECDLGEIAAAPPDRAMAFELSNRHLRNGFRRVLDVGVLTGITLNHEPDHGSFAAYRAAKYSIARRSRDFIYHASIPVRYPDAAAMAACGEPFGGTVGWRLVGDHIVAPDGGQFSLPGATELSAPNRDDAVAAAAAAVLVGATALDIEQRSRALADTTPRYRQAARTVAGRLFVNDAASCMPAATAAFVASFERPFVLICGGNRQRYRRGEFDQLARAVADNPGAAMVCTMGPMAEHIEQALAEVGFSTVERTADLSAAVTTAGAVPHAAVVFSPACGEGDMFLDKHARGAAFDDAVDAMESHDQAIR